MMNQEIKDEQIHLSIDGVDFSYRISIKKLGYTIDWKIGEKGTKGIVVKNVSKWALQLFTKSVADSKYITQFKGIIQELAPNNTINWDDTFLALNVQKKYNELASTKENDEEKIISILKKKYKLD